MNEMPTSQYYSVLSNAQKIAADFNEGALLLLAGPGSGKTRVLTARLCRLLSESKGEKFRVLALTFTNAAAAEIRDRLEMVSPDATERSFVGTFHSFCADLLRQHGSLVSVEPNFAVLTEEDERIRIFKRALLNYPDISHRVSEFESSNKRILPLIDKLKSRGVDKQNAKARFRNSDVGDLVFESYRIYDQGMKDNNVLDFASILQKSYELVRDFPNVARLIRITYRYWSVDEFQDTNEIQYRILTSLANGDFGNLFAVADEDQIIYQWNGASYKRLEQLVADFKPKVLQLPKNYRCPEPIVDLANRLIANNSLRRADKYPTQAIDQGFEYASDQVIELHSYSSDREEARGIANNVSNFVKEDSSVAILARNRFILEMIQSALVENDIPSRLVQRRTDFLSKTYALGYRLIKMCVRNSDEGTLEKNIDTLVQLTQLELSKDSIVARAKSEQVDLYLALMHEIRNVSDENHPNSTKWIKLLTGLKERELDPNQFINELAGLVEEDVDGDSPDVKEDRDAWRKLHGDIRSVLGSKPPLDRYLQELDMRSKEPPLKSGEVALMTIHSSKGMEFDVVFLAGLAEEVLPSWQSLKTGSSSPELEEERRNCFVAITRARKKLILTYAGSYRGWSKSPSRFLKEMSLI